MTTARRAAIGLLTFALAGRALGQATRWGPPEPLVDIAQFSRGLDSGDVDGDGDRDLVATFSAGFNVVTFLNDGNGVLSDPLYSDPGSARELALGDVDGDGALDVVTAGVFDLFLMRGLGDGAFGPQEALSPVTDVRELRLADFDGDGALDVVLWRSDAAMRLEWLAGDGDGGFGPIRLVDELPAAQFDGAFRTLEVGDVDGDGRADVLCGGQHPALGGFLRLHRSTGTGFELLIDVTTATHEDGLLADVDGDGDLDLLAATELTVGLFPGDGAGGFGPLTTFAGMHVLSLAVGDVTGDGLTDVVGFDAGDLLHVWHGLGDGVFVHELTAVLAMPETHDGDLTLVELDGSGRLGMLREAENPILATWQRNLTYGPGEPWSDLGAGLEGFDGGELRAPYTWGEGDLTAGTDFALVGHGDGGGWTPWLVFGAALLASPFHGGVLVPTPDVVIGPFPVAPLNVVGDVVPAGLPSGVALRFQWWYAPSLPGGAFGASPGLQAITP